APVTYIGTITNSIGAGGGTVGFSKNGPGTLVLTSADPFSGGTTINAGTLQVTADNGLGNGNVLIGTNSTTALPLFGNLDLTTTNQIVTGLTVGSNSSATTDTINIGGSLTVLGNILFGSNLSASDSQNVVFTGGGTLIQNGTT